MQDAILHIDTASNRGLVMLSKSGKPLAVRTNLQAFDHAAFVQPAIKEIMEEAKVHPHNILAIAVANGPGSYTGLRVGLASAKGLCFAWQKPLITLSSLQLMAISIAMHQRALITENTFISPMIDARRMEVFYSLYNFNGLKTINDATSAILDESFLYEQLDQRHIIFSGDGAAKWQAICKHPNAIFLQLPLIDDAFATLAFQKHVQLEFADLAYCEPFYTKEFYTTAKKL